ncbi:MAG: MFS transporter [Rhodobacteraceae bacterium]|nr:MFS transporter [Paracoccaceae bacterium]
MIGRYIPDFLRRAPEPGARGFAILGLCEAAYRGTLISVWPLILYNALGSASAVSGVYFAVGVASLACGLLVPWFGRAVPRRWLYTISVGLYMIAAVLTLASGAAFPGGGHAAFAPVALLLSAWATVICFVCTNAYVMDYIAREDLGRNETLRLFYSALPWAVGPVTGVWLWRQWPPLPFIVALGAAVCMLTVFWILRLGNGKVIARAHGPTPNPLAYLGRFFSQPRLIAGWSFAVIRSSGWWIYVVSLPIFCIEAGLGDQIASAAFSTSSLILFAAPLMLRWMQRRGLRNGVVTAFACAAGCFLLAACAGLWPPLAVIGLFAGAIFLIMLDTFGGLPFLMAVKPAERTEMSAVYSSFRDVSGILTPGVSWVVLLVLPITGVFAAGGLAMAGAALVATRLHPRLGASRRRRAPA